jgi:hypothetical protein
MNRTLKPMNDTRKKYCDILANLKFLQKTTWSSSLTKPQVKREGVCFVEMAISCVFSRQNVGAKQLENEWDG